MPFSLLIIALVPMFLFQNCGGHFQPLADMASQAQAGSDFCGDGGVNCAGAIPVGSSCQFDGQTLAEGQSVTAFLNSSGSCLSEQRICSSGILSGSYQYSSCRANAEPACLFGGKTVASGEVIVAYLKSTVPEGETCLSERRLCKQGVLSGSYEYSSCETNTYRACLFNGATIAHGQSVTAYASSSGSCQPQTRTCLNGALTGAGDYAVCVAAQTAPASCLFAGRTVNSGSSVVAYATSMVANGVPCQSQTRTCSNGVLSGSWQFASCVSEQPASCLFNGQTIPHGGSRVLYLNSAADSAGRCPTETRVCSNGVLSGTAQHASCTPKIVYGPKNNGKYFAHFLVEPQQIAEVNGYLNTLVVAADEVSLKAVADNNLSAIAVVSSAFFYKDTQTGKFGMYSDYKERWARMVPALQKYKSRVVGLYPLDEPYWHAVNTGVSLETMYNYLVAAADLVKKDFPDIALIYNEAYPMVVSDLRLPPNYDIYSFDCYDGWDLCGFPVPQRPQHVRQPYMSMFNLVKSKVNALNNADGGQRKMLILPPASIFKDGMGNMGMSEVQLRQITDNFMNLAATDPMVWGVVTFLWTSFDEGGGRWMGLKDLSQETRLKFKYFYQQFSGKEIRLKPVAVTAGSTAGGSSISSFTDGNLKSVWNSGKNAGNDTWIQVDLGKNHWVQEIYLAVAQLPNGETTHEIWAGPTESSMVKQHVFSQNTSDGQILHLANSALQARSDIRYIKIKTTKSPSWVAWQEILIHGTPAR
ncbi:discoidin domain-containing protein [Bdellovibrio sp. ArHS]|uniref:discoidin domain-containing protein n=1 Tax=Bdellovibrio sp. ArHS TaxID=1569284 RepID=UPI0025C1F157|nr:discoidin domain-containing protein [Bdellovibrio sp. ArHS]